MDFNIYEQDWSAGIPAAGTAALLISPSALAFP